MSKPYCNTPGIHMAQAKWAQRPSVVGFIAPPKESSTTYWKCIIQGLAQK